jgi:hypothetical protein
MAIQIVEIHPADEPDALNTEWFIVENRGERPFNTRNCVLVRRRRGQKKKIELGTIEPGFVLGPGDKVRVLTGNPGRKAHGKAPKDDITNYNLFLNEPVLRGTGTVLTLALRSHPVASAIFDADAERGIATSTETAPATRGKKRSKPRKRT